MSESPSKERTPEYSRQLDEIIKQGNPSQSARFTEAVRQLGADKDEAALKAKLAQIARQRPKGEVPEPPKGDKDN